MVYEKTRNLNSVHTLYEEQSLKRNLNKTNSEISVDYAEGNILKRHIVLNKTKYLERHFNEVYAQDMVQTLEIIRDKEIIVNNVFVFTIATNIVNDHDP